MFIDLELQKFKLTQMLVAWTDEAEKCSAILATKLHTLLHPVHAQFQEAGMLTLIVKINVLKTAVDRTV